MVPHFLYHSLMGQFQTRICERLRPYREGVHIHEAVEAKLNLCCSFWEVIDDPFDQQVARRFAWPMSSSACVSMKTLCFDGKSMHLQETLRPLGEDRGECFERIHVAEEGKRAFPLREQCDMWHPHRERAWTDPLRSRAQDSFPPSLMKSLSAISPWSTSDKSCNISGRIRSGRSFGNRPIAVKVASVTWGPYEKTSSKMYLTMRATRRGSVSGEATSRYTSLFSTEVSKASTFSSSEKAKLTAWSLNDSVRERG